MSTAAPLQNLAAKPKPLSSSTHAGLLLQRKCACGAPTASLTGECAECKSRKRLQTKLTIGASNDPLEQEADRVADQVLAAPANPAISGARPHIQRLTGQATGQTDTAPASVDRVLASPGSSLEPALRQDMEQRFGHDFSRVRVHSGAGEDQSAREIAAHAYTAGSHIVFVAGKFDPGHSEGRRLLAHELTHVVQQSGHDGRSARGGHLSSDSLPTLIRRDPDDNPPKKEDPKKDAPKKQPAKKTLKSEGVDVKDPVAANTATIIDGVLARNQKLAPYIGDKLKAGIKIAAKGKFVHDLSDGNFDDAFRKAYDLDSGDSVSKDIPGFYDPKTSEIHLRPSSEFGTALHESVHRLATPTLYATYLPTANKISTDFMDVLKEGVTAFFTDSILSDEGLPNFNDAYRSEKKKAKKLIDALGSGGFDLIAKLNFTGNGIVEIGEKLGFTKKQWAQGGGIREVLKRMEQAI